MQPESGYRLFRQACFAACAFVCLWTLAGAQNAKLTEEQIKAGFLFNFTKFVEWPANTFPDANAPIVLGIVGESPITHLLSEISVGKSVNGRAVEVRSFKTGQDLRVCQILFIGASEARHVGQILEGLKGSNVLTVSEVGGFAQSGGMINFYVEGNNVRLEINLDTAVNGGLKISSKVIAVARLVPGDSLKGKS
jgi:hypothetical protein